MNRIEISDKQNKKHEEEVKEATKHNTENNNKDIHTHENKKHTHW